MSKNYTFEWNLLDYIKQLSTYFFTAWKILKKKVKFYILNTFIIYNSKFKLVVKFETKLVFFAKRLRVSKENYEKNVCDI